MLSLAMSIALLRLVTEPFLERGSSAETLGELAAVEDNDAGFAETAGKMSWG